jgi:tellurite resistance protein TehA-like permease/glutaredoxin-related protein
MAPMCCCRKLWTHYLPLVSKTFSESGAKGLVETLKTLPIALVGKPRCAYSIEAYETLTAAAANVGGADSISTYWLDGTTASAAIHNALKEELKQPTVPYVFINGEFIGGCDSTKLLQTQGTLAPKLYAAAAAHGLPKPTVRVVATNAGDTNVVAASGGGTGAAHDDNGHTLTKFDSGHSVVPYSPNESFFDSNFKPGVAETGPSAPPPLFYFPEVVESNVVRLTASQVVVICILGVVFRTHLWARYMILGLAVENVLRFFFGAGPSPLAQLARCGAALMKPHFKPGVPKQFAAECGSFMAIVSTIFLFTSGFDHREIIPACFLSVYACLAFAEAAFDFCMGCVMFGWLVQFGILDKNVYAVGIATKPEAEYTYAEATKIVELAEPERVRLQYPGKPASVIDVKYKVKTNDHDRQVVDIFKHVKIAHFNMILGFCGLAVLWRLAAIPSIGGAAGLSISNAPGDVFVIISVILYAIFGGLYMVKLFKYPNKVAKEWMCPLRSNSFAVPPACLVLIAFAVNDRFDHADSLAKVLFWIGAPINLFLALYLGARWITDQHSQEHLNAAWLLAPMACFVCALIAPFLDSIYTEAAYLWFSVATALTIPLYVLTFHKSLIFNEPDDRNRLLKWTWVAAPAVACASQIVLNAFTRSSVIAVVDLGSLAFDFTSRVLYFIALSLGMMLGLLFLTGHTSRLKFDPTSTWAIIFPLEALALVTIMYAAAVQGTLSTGMAYAGLTVASAAVALCTFQSVQTLLMGSFFVMDAKYGPLSQQILTHEAFRAAGMRLTAAVGALDPEKTGSVNGAALADFALQFRRYRMAHAWHAAQEENIIFREFENYAPELCSRQHSEHAEHEMVMERWAAAIDTLEASLDLFSNNNNKKDHDDGDSSDAVTTSIDLLMSEIPAFITEFEAHMVGEEEHLQRGGRKHINLDLQKQMIRKIWDTTPVEVWTEFFPFVVANLPMHQQRVKFIRCFAVWAVPERAQLIGRMIAMGVDAPLWSRIKLYVPEIVPRGDSNWRKYF